MGASLSARTQRVSMRIIVASLALCAVFALALGETEIDESVFQAIEDDVAQTVQTLKGLQGDDVAVTELDDESAAPKAKKAGKKKAKKAIAKAKAAGAKKVKKDKKKAKDKLKKQAKKKAAKLKKLKKKAKKHVTTAVYLKNTGIRRFKAIITRTQQRYGRRMDRAKARVLKAQRRSLKRLQRSSGGKAAIKAARKLRHRAQLQNDAETAKKLEQKTKLNNAMATHNMRSSVRKQRHLYRHLDRKARYHQALKKEEYLRRQVPGNVQMHGRHTPTARKAELKTQFETAMAALKRRNKELMTTP